jgi:hypothetical protein
MPLDYFATLLLMEKIKMTKPKKQRPKMNQKNGPAKKKKIKTLVKCPKR